MNTTKPPPAVRLRTAKGGQTLRASIDPRSAAQLAHAKRIAIEHLEFGASSSTIVRRALDLYSDFLHCIAFAEFPDLEAVARERNRLAAAAKGYHAPLPAHVLESAPLLPLHDMASEHQKSLPGVMDMIRADLKRWKRELAHKPKQDESNG